MPKRARRPRPTAVTLLMAATAFAAVSASSWATSWAAAEAPAWPGTSGPPAAWPPGTPAPQEVLDAARDLRDRSAAWRAEVEGLDAEIRFGPQARLLWRDDPPRPLDASLDAAPEVRLVWSPLQSEALLAEARVIEAETAVQDAWRDAVVRAWEAPVAAMRDLHALHAAESGLRDAEEAASQARSALRAAALEARRPDLVDVPSSAELLDPAADRPDPVRSAAAAAVAAELDVRDAVVRAQDARGSAATWFAYAPPAADPVFGRGWDRLASWDPRNAPPPELDAGLRTELALPAAPDPEAMRAYAARAARTEAVVARAARYRLRAVVPSASLQAGYAGSEAGVQAELGVRAGRPRVELGGSLQGTVQERFWVRLGATLRLGSDVGATARNAERARADRERTLSDLARDAATDAARAIAAARAAEERWRVAEERLLLARLEGNEARIARAEDDARRRWSHYLTAAGRAWTRTETPPLRTEP